MFYGDTTCPRSIILFRMSWSIAARLLVFVGVIGAFGWNTYHLVMTH